jgi:2-dehydro-3-deoxy-D-arabinonate dehydratase
VRLCAVWNPSENRRALCVADGDGIYPVARFGDVAELLSSHRGSLEAAVEAAGVSSDSLGRYDELTTIEPGSGELCLVAPVAPVEVWAAGLTYERSRDARMHESSEQDVYERAYEAERPELFFKATGARVMGPGASVGLRADSEWQIPEPEIALVLDTTGGVVGYTLGNDMSSRDIEGENPLYLGQAKIFAGSCAIGPSVVSTAAVEDPYSLEIEMSIVRGGETVFAGSTSTARLHKQFDVLAAFMKRDNWIAPGTVLLTGTGIVPPDEFTLRPGDVIEISNDPIGLLHNRCEPAGDLVPPPGWTLPPST